MAKLTRTHAAPWAHTLGLGFSVGAAFSLPTVRDWMLSHPEQLAALIAVVSRLWGMGISRLPQFRQTAHSLTVTTERVHDRIDAVIDTLAVIQADLDTAAEAVRETRREAQDLDRA